ncbi:homocysteine S-methyltransferase family protein [Marinivivus vitaminiproducens]|uniref:homocysteine S-methyltransferase family protein n=1 Tax=Marinivivus vitaminiproducens TaxID=3035935 RepID=UPI0027A6184A|nr:homocysteine S-methyltransferase family protein [Geminicoccaceae bacterium SCSIO 64248]
MALSRYRLPEADGRVFLTDTGLEAWLIQAEGIDLACKAAFPLLETEAGRDRLDSYAAPFLHAAQAFGTGFVLNTPTWRASSDWGGELGFSRSRLAVINRRAVAWAAELRASFATAETPVVIGGLIGPRGDDYSHGLRLSVNEAQAYHRDQIEILHDAGADLISAPAIMTVDEAIGITRAAAAVGIPVLTGFQVGRDGCLPSGVTLAAALAELDRATGSAPLGAMVDGERPDEMEMALPDARGFDRVRCLTVGGLRRDADLRDAVIDQARAGRIGESYRMLRTRLPGVSILGVPCGLDHSSIRTICRALLPVSGAAAA